MLNTVIWLIMRYEIYERLKLSTQWAVLNRGCEETYH